MYKVHQPRVLSTDVGQHLGDAAPPDAVPKKAVLRDLLSVLSSLLVGLAAWALMTHTNQTYAAPSSTVPQTIIAPFLASSHTKLLIGNYFDTLSTRQANTLGVATQALAGCGGLQPVTPRGAPAHVHNYAVVFKESTSPADLGRCSMAQIVQRYGKPHLALTLRNLPLRPARMLLLYGQPKLTKKLIRHVVTAVPATPVPPPPAPAPVIPPVPVLPTRISDLPSQCPAQTVMNIVAHEDDDVLFMNPETIHNLQAGNCVRTVYLTAGDDGRSSYYWRGRQRGAEAAYASMMGLASVWRNQIVTLQDGSTVTVASLSGTTRVSLVFLNLPDGNLDGSGFASKGNQSLYKLQSGVISTISSVDHQADFSSASLTATITAFMNQYRPTQINTQANDVGLATADHSDHIATGQYATAAATAYGAAAVHYFMGYPMRDLAPNLTPDDVAAKSSAYFAYAVHDSEACATQVICDQANSSYSLYLTRQYTP